VGGFCPGKRQSPRGLRVAGNGLQVRQSGPEMVGHRAGRVQAGQCDTLWPGGRRSPTLCYPAQMAVRSAGLVGLP